MVDIKLLRDLGITQEFLKRRLSVEPLSEGATTEEKTDQEKVSKLLNRIRARVDAGESRSFADWQWLYMIDKAWETPFTQFHPRLFGALEGGQMQTACSILSSLNLGGLVETTKDASGKECQSFNEEKFRLLVGLVRSYTTIRWAKIVNDRRLTPFHKFEPAKALAVQRARCEVLTDRVQVMSIQYSYFDVMKWQVLKMLQYGTAIKFIKEEWHFEEQVRYATPADIEAKKPRLGSVTEADPEGASCVDGDKVKYIEREGLRYDIPHPSRVYRDLAHPLFTINSDSGLSFLGNWVVVPFRDVNKKERFWNTDKVTFGNESIINTNKAFFETVYTACRLEIPVITRATAPTGGGSNDLQQQLVNDVYTSDMDDKGVVLVNHFEKLVPSEWGLGNYDGPVWFRFLLAGNGRTVLYATPLPSIPATYMGYDADESRAKNASLAMEILPYQYQFENLLQQVIESCKQNLANLTLVNTDILDENQKKKLEGLGPMLWKKLNLFGASFRGIQKILQRMTGSTTQDLGVSLSLPKANIAELVNVSKTVLDVLERVLVMSSHEVAQAASHEQTREEVRNIAQSTSSRLTFTATPVDIERDAWKRQIYAYLMTYGDDDFYGTITSEIELTKEVLTALGFSFVDNDTLAGKDKFRRVRVKKSALALPLYEFASTRDGEDRMSDREVAMVMATFARDVMSNPITAQAIGPDQALDMANRIAHLAGVDRDFKLQNVGGSPEQQQAQAQEQLKQVVQMVLQQSQEQLVKAITPIVTEMKEMQTEIATLMRVTGIAPPPPGQGQGPTQGVPPQMPQMPMGPPMGA